MKLIHYALELQMPIFPINFVFTFTQTSTSLCNVYSRVCSSLQTSFSRNTVFNELLPHLAETTRRIYLESGLVVLHGLDVASLVFDGLRVPLLAFLVSEFLELGRN